MPDLTQRHTTRRNRHRRIIARGHPPCGICGDEIDYDAHHLDPLSFTIDHIQPLAKNGLDELANLQAAHRKCNRDKSDTTAADVVPKRAGCTYETWRTWTPTSPTLSQLSAG